MQGAKAAVEAFVLETEVEVVALANEATGAVENAEAAEHDGYVDFRGRSGKAISCPSVKTFQRARGSETGPQRGRHPHGGDTQTTEGSGPPALGGMLRPL